MGSANVAICEPPVTTGSEARLLRLLADCAGRLLAATHPTEMIEYLFEMVRKELALDVYFHYRVHESNQLALEAHGGLGPHHARAGSQLCFGQAVCGVVARDRVPRVVSSIQASSDPLVAFIKEVGLDSYACTPLLHGSTLLGTLGFGRRSATPFTETELTFLRTVCSYVAIAKNRLLVEAELLEAFRARDTLTRNQAALIEQLAGEPLPGAAWTLAATLAHEMKQPLAAASNYIAMVEAALRGAGADALRPLVEARRQIARSAEIVERARALIETGDVQVEFVDSQTLFCEAIDLVRAACGPCVPRIVPTAQTGAERVLADRVQIVQVLANLIRNAAAATADKADATIFLQARRCTDGIEFAVEDNGIGFLPDARPRVGESTGGGQGLGLSLCRRIVEAHGSSLSFENRQGGGAGVSFVLPSP